MRRPCRLERLIHIVRDTALDAKEHPICQRGRRLGQDAVGSAAPRAFNPYSSAQNGLPCSSATRSTVPRRMRQWMPRWAR